MILSFWQYVRGYLRLRINGFSVERFLNMVVYRGIYIWNVERTPEGVYINVSVKGFRRLIGCGRKTKCTTKIISKHGFPFLIHRYRKRKVLLGGILFFMLMMFTLSSFIWRVEIIGSADLAHESILTFLDEQGLRIGSFKHRINAQDITRELLNAFPELSWADIHTRGTRTTVMIAESLPHQPIVDRQTPMHVVAAHDGLITRIATSSGAPLVRQNDVVHQGEMLVSGIIELNADMGNPTTVYVHAYAEVWARRYHTIEFGIPLTYTENIYTGRTTTRRSLQLLFAGNISINLPRGGISFGSYDRMTTHHQLGISGDYPLPFVFVTETYSEFTPTQRTRSVEDARELADRILTNRILREFDFGIDIIARDVELFETPDTLNVKALITTHERIDIQIPID